MEDGPPGVIGVRVVQPVELPLGLEHEPAQIQLHFMAEKIVLMHHQSSSNACWLNAQLVSNCRKKFVSRDF